MEKLDAVVRRPYAFIEGMVVFWIEKVKIPAKGKNKASTKKVPHFCQIISLQDESAEIFIAGNGIKEMKLADLKWCHDTGRSFHSGLGYSFYTWPVIPESFIRKMSWSGEQDKGEAIYLVGQKVAFVGSDAFRHLTGHTQSACIGHAVGFFPNGDWAVASTVVYETGPESLRDPVIIRASYSELAPEGEETWEAIASNWKVFQVGVSPHNQIVWPPSAVLANLKKDGS